MPTFSTPGILLRRVDFSDYDLIITLYTLNHGKMAVMAKAAKKSVKRFGGVLELFSVLNIVCSARPTGGGLPFLQEASLIHPFFKIREDICKTAYASYWVELINEWMEEGTRKPALYELLFFVLTAIEEGAMPEAVLSIIFQMRFMSLSGLVPNLRTCSRCGLDLEKINLPQVGFDVKRGGVICGGCDTRAALPIKLSRRTIKELLWIESGNMAKAKRMRFTPQGIKEGLRLLEAFVPYHLGKEPRSLKILRQVRD